MSTEARLREGLVLHGRSLHERGLSPGSSGNLSARLDDGLLVTPTSSCLGRLDPERISHVDGDGKHLSGDKPSKEEEFRAAVLDQARNSLRLEPDCQQFDVCRNPEDPSEVLLYEVYASAAAFEAHQQTDHFAGFGARVQDMVESKEVSTWEKVGGARGA